MKQRQSTRTTMDFAIVELKYVEKGMYIVPIGNIKSSKPKVSTDPYFCYISADLTEEPNFDAKYYEKFEGSPGVFKVFIRKITNTFEEAASFLKVKRMQIVPKKYRQPSNTDSELKAAAAKKKKVEKQILKVNKKNANARNSLHLAEILAAADSNAITVASKFEELVRRTLEDCDDSDTENYPLLQSFQSIASVSNSDALQSQPEPISKSKKEISLPRTSTSAIVIPRNLPLSSRNPQDVLKNGSPEIRIESHQFDATDKENKSDASNHFIVTPVHSNGTKEATVNKPQGMKPKVLSGRNGENSLFGTVPSQVLEESKQMQNKRKMSIEDDIDRTAKKSKSSVNEHDIVPRNNFRFHADTDSDEVNLSNSKVVFEVSEIINIDELIKQKGALDKENKNLKSENELLKERNAALQNALVTASKSAAQVPFEEEDGGRRYSINTERTKNVFLNSVQCKILDSIDEHRAYLNNLVLAVFGAETLKNSSVTGRQGNRTKAPSSPALDPTKLKFIYDSMEARTNKCTEFSKVNINKIINKKIANLRSVGKERVRKKSRAAKNIVEANESEDTMQFTDEARCSNSPNESEVANKSHLVNMPLSNGIIFPDNVTSDDSSIIDIVDFSSELQDLSGLMTYNF